MIAPSNGIRRPSRKYAMARQTALAETILIWERTPVAATRLKRDFENIDNHGQAKTPPTATHGRHFRG
jgi:hypothetical protein